MISFPLVSICIPAYNAAKYISETLDSVLCQSYDNIEIIVVNDGSIDDTAAILDKYRLSGITIIEQVNKGQCSAANAAFKACKGEYIKFFDADDIMSENFIEEQVRKLEGTIEMIASASWGRFYNDDLSTFKLNTEPVWKDMYPVDWLVESLWNGPNMMQCGLWLIPRSVLLRSGLWDERLSLINDFDFFVRVLLASTRILFVEQSILYYRSGLSTSLSADSSEKAMKSALLSVKLGTETLLRYENSERTRKICADSFQYWKYRFYPEHMTLYLIAKENIKALGGSSFELPAGGWTKYLRLFLGWKLTIRTKRLLINKRRY